MAITVFKRHEKKFLLNESQMYLMLPMIMDHMIPDKYCKGGKTYTICNLYFDTEKRRRRETPPLFGNNNK